MLQALNKMEWLLGQPIARLNAGNANEFLIILLLKSTDNRAIHVDPTTPHTPQENSLAERVNITLISRVRATSAAALVTMPTRYHH